MSINLLNLAKDYLSGEAIEKAASFLGESKEATESGFAHALPALLGGVLNKANSSSGAADLLGLITKPELGNILGNIGNLFGGSESSSNLGGSLLSSVLGGKLGGITDLIGSAVGFKNQNSSSGILKMAAPLLLGVIGKKVGNSGISGLLNLLSGQQKHLEEAAPSGFLSKALGALGVGSLGNLINGFAKSASTGSTKTSSTNESSAPKKKGNNNLWLLLALLGLFLLGFFGYKSCSGDHSTSSENSIEKIKEGVHKTGEALKNGANKAGNAIVEGADAIYNAGAGLVGKTVKGFENLGAFISKKIGNGVELIIPSKGFEAKLIDFIESDKAVDKTTWFNMRRVLFQTGSANLDERSMNQIENIAKILKAYPNVHLKIGGYTDNTGNADTNKKLSANRAKAVLNALVAKGINAARLTSEGYGPEHPIASNDTAEGRKLNRRVAARVTKK